jgi:hypothetical protein
MNCLFLAENCMSDISLFLIPGFLFLVTVGFGFWVSRTGKPYNQILFNVHKLTALGGVVLVVIRIMDLGLFQGLQRIFLFSVVGAFMAVIGLFATGALMSIREDEPVIIKWLHRGALALLFISSVLLICLLF